MNHQTREIEKLLKANINDIYAQLGIHLSSQMPFPPPRAELIQQAKRWIFSKRSALAEILCNNDKLRKLNSQDANIQNRIVLVTSIIDLISSVVTGIAAMTVAVLLVREGLSSLCRETWDSIE